MNDIIVTALAIIGLLFLTFCTVLSATVAAAFTWHAIKPETKDELLKKHVMDPTADVKHIDEALSIVRN